MKLAWYAKLYILMLFFAGILSFFYNLKPFHIDFNFVALFFSAIVVSYIGVLPLKNSINLVSILFPVIYFNYGIIPVIILDIVSIFLDKLINRSVYVIFFNIGQLIISNLGTDFLYKLMKVYLPNFELFHIIFFISVYIIINNILVISILCCRYFP
ncbi:hypothetical protein CTH_2124 [Carboxydocella thermautotrophica]|nr:hypothetical protein CTH_2124 [Carboxydocella thermautotrophica]